MNTVKSTNELLQLKSSEEPEPLTTKSMPYTTEVPVPPSKITLADFKQYINRRNYKFYYKVMDPVLRMEVKTDILNEDAILTPNADGRYELFLLSDNAPQLASSSTASTMPPQGYRRSVQGPNELKNYPPSRNGYYPSSRRNSKYDNRRYFDDSSSQEESNLFGDSNLRIPSDEDSQSSTGFTSVSQQYGANKHYDSSNKPCWSRNKRRRPKKSLSFLSSTMDDTEVSMALDLITVSFHMDPRLNFGMKVVAVKKPTFIGIYVHEVKKGSIVALDGRIKVGYLILEVDGIPLDQFETEMEKIKFLKNKVELATVSQGYLELTCVRTDGFEQMNNGNPFRLPPEPVRPIDPLAWVQHCNAMRGLNIISEEAENAMSPAPKQNIQTHSIPSNNYPIGKHNNLPELTRADYLPQSSVQAGNSTGAAAPRGPSSGVGSSIVSSNTGRLQANSNKPFHVHMDKLSIIRAMADPVNGLRLRRHGKTENSFAGSEMLSWLEKNVVGLENQIACESYASELLKDRLILQAVTKKEFTQQCYYTFNEELTSKIFRSADGLNTIRRGALTLIPNPTMELSSFDELTVSTANRQSAQQLARKSKCKRGFRWAFWKIFCLHPNRKYPIKKSTHIP